MHRLGAVASPGVVCALLTLCWVGCSDEPGGGGAETDTGADSTDTSGVSKGNQRCEPDKDLDGFTVRLLPQYSTLGGRVWDGVSVLRARKELASALTCRLLTTHATTCDPACTPGNECGIGDKCVPAPRKMDVGEVSITGLAKPVKMSAIAPVNEYNFVGELGHPAFSPGAKVTLTAAGGKASPFTIEAVGVAPLEAQQHAPLVKAGLPVTVTWTTDEVAHGDVTIVLNVNQHGTGGGEIACVAKDSGSFTIPAMLVDGLLKLGTSGFPALTIVRQGSGIATIAQGCVGLTLVSSTVLDVNIPGLVSCSGPEDCPAGQSCTADLVCQ